MAWCAGERAPTGRPRPAYPIDLSVRRGLSERGTGSGLVLPVCNQQAMQLHLDAIAPQVAPAAHAILLLDRAGWQGAKALKVPRNISLMPLPARAPELNPQENIWQFMRQNWLSSYFPSS
jgi:putative transposase